MRSISAASLAALQQETGVQPAIIVRVWWGGSTATRYCDRQFETEGLVGKLLSISGIEDVIDINAAATSVSLTVTLDDADGQIKRIYNRQDIHKLRVQVLQWFATLPLNEAFAIFEGEISSPIVWSEGARTLTFDVISKLEDKEMGFSAEEGQFPYIPASLIGKAWPIVFGRVAGIQLLNLTEPPSAILASGFGIVNQEIWEAELADLNAAYLLAFQNANDAYRLALNNVFIAGAFKRFGPLPDDPQQALQYDNAAQSYFAQANEYTEEYLRILAEIQAKQEEKELQESYELRVLPIVQTNLPTGYSLEVEIGNYTANAVVVGSQIVLTNLTEILDVNEKVGTNQYSFGSRVNEYERITQGQKFTWIDGGTTIKVKNFPRYYIASYGHITVLNVWARSKYGRAVVPTAWYIVEHVNYGSLPATRIYFPTPITSMPGDWEDGEIEFDAESDIGPNVVDIMQWAIDNFSTLESDTASFNHVRSLVNAYPANFALIERKDVIRFLQEVAFQSRCAIWVNDRKFFLRYLPERLTAVETITDSDVEVNSLTVTTTETERLVTKFTALWRERLSQSEPNKIIYRNNIQKYGVLEEEYDFYIYNNQELVAKSAEFWMIRKSNTWKRIILKALLHKLRIETFDPVEFDFEENIISTSPVIGIIERATFNPDDDTIQIEAWLPIRLGSMVEYTYAYPKNVTEVYPDSDPDISTGNPFEDATGEIIPEIFFPPNQQVTYSYFNPFTNGRGVPIGDAGDTAPGSLVTALTPGSVNGNRPAGIETFNNEKKTTVNPIDEFVFREVKPSSFYAEVIAQTDDPNVYTMNVWLNGLANDPTELSVQIPYIPEDEVLNEGYSITVNRAVFYDSEDTLTFEYWAIPPLWVDNEDSSEE